MFSTCGFFVGRSAGSCRNLIVRPRSAKAGANGGRRGGVPERNSRGKNDASVTQSCYLFLQRRGFLWVGLGGLGLQALQHTVHFLFGVVMNQSNAQEAAVVLHAHPLSQVEGVIVAIPGEDAALA